MNQAAIRRIYIDCWDHNPYIKLNQLPNESRFTESNLETWAKIKARIAKGPVMFRELCELATDHHVRTPNGLVLETELVPDRKGQYVAYCIMNCWLSA